MFRKIVALLLPVLVLVGMFGGGVPRVEAQQPHTDYCTAAEIAAGWKQVEMPTVDGTIRTCYPPGHSATTGGLRGARAEWTVSQGYKFNPSVNTIEITIDSLRLLRPDGSPLQKGDRLVKPNGDNTDPIEGFYFGVALAHESASNWDCAAGFNWCEFKNIKVVGGHDGGTSQLFDLASTSSLSNHTVTLDVSALDKAGLQRLKVVPVLKPDGGDHWVADSGSAGFALVWDASVNGSNPVVNPAEGRSGSAGFVTTDKSWANNVLGGAVMSVVNIILATVFKILTWVLDLINYLIVYPLINAMLGPELSATKIPDFVYNAWVYVRDVMNLLFILVLIFSGVAIMLRIDGYNLKKIVGRVIAMALLVNFSLLFAQIILNFAQIIMTTFIDPATINNLANGLDKLEMGDLFSSSTSGAFAGAIVLIFTFVYKLGVTIVMFAVAALLVLRLAGIWLLMIVAPAAYIISITKGGEKYFSQWWSKFLSYAFFAPIMAFIIGITANLVAMDSFLNLDIAGTGSFAGTTQLAIQSILALVMLSTGLNYAKKAGVAGADVVVKKADHAWRSVGKFGALTAPKFASRGIGAGLRNAANVGWGPKADLAGKIKRLEDMQAKATKGTSQARIQRQLASLRKRQAVGKFAYPVLEGAGQTFRKAPIAGAIAKHVIDSMKKNVHENEVRETRVAAGMTEAHMAEAKGIGGLMRYLGAEDEAKAVAVNIEMQEYNKKYKDLPLTGGEMKKIARQAALSNDEALFRVMTQKLLAKNQSIDMPPMEINGKVYAGEGGFVALADDSNYNLDGLLKRRPDLAPYTGSREPTDKDIKIEVKNQMGKVSLNDLVKTRDDSFVVESDAAVNTKVQALQNAGRAKEAQKMLANHRRRVKTVSLVNDTLRAKIDAEVGNARNPVVKAREVASKFDVNSTIGQKVMQELMDLNFPNNPQTQPAIQTEVRAQIEKQIKERVDDFGPNPSANQDALTWAAGMHKKFDPATNPHNEVAQTVTNYLRSRGL